MRQLTYAKTIELDLSTARDDEYFNIAGTTIVALYRDGDVYIKLDSKSNTPLNLRQIPKIENADFQCFYVSNSAQPGKKAILLVGYNIDVDRQVLSLEELQSALNDMYDETVNLANATLELKNLFVNGTLLVGPLPDHFIHDMFINYPEGVKGELPSSVTDRTELSPLAYMENLPEGTIITRYLYAGERISVGDKVLIEKTTGNLGRITIQDTDGNDQIIIGESALPDGSDGIFINSGGKFQINQETDTYYFKWDGSDLILQGQLRVKSSEYGHSIIDFPDQDIKLGFRSAPDADNPYCALSYYSLTNTNHGAHLTFLIPYDDEAVNEEKFGIQWHAEFTGKMLNNQDIHKLWIGMDLTDYFDTGDVTARIKSADPIEIFTTDWDGNDASGKPRYILLQSDNSYIKLSTPNNSVNLNDKFYVNTSYPYVPNNVPLVLSHTQDIDTNWNGDEPPGSIWVYQNRLYYKDDDGVVRYLSGTAT